MNLEKLFLKYICHIGAAEGIEFATLLPIAPCGMGELEFAEEEKEMLKELFEKAKSLYNFS